MYPHFIEVTRNYKDAESWKACINIDNITDIEDHTIMLRNHRVRSDMEDSMWVEESYEELKQLIQEAGCSINRADPRIDSRSSLTMNQIMRILGEPVWNSNLNQWALVHYYNPDNDTIQLMNPGGKIYIMTEEEMIRFPLYRMKGAEQ